MQSMLGLVSTMAEEMQYFRSKLSSKQVDSSDTMDNIQVIPNFLGGNGNIQNMLDNELIEVSDSEVEDDDEDDEDEDEEDEEEEDDENEDEEDEDIDSEVEDDINSEIEEHEIEELDTDDNKKIINIDLGTTNDDFVIESEEIDFRNNDTNDNTVKNISLDLSADELISTDEMISNDELISTDELNLENMESTLKSISIDDNVSSKGKEDYKKMSLNKLRDIVCAKGLVVDASKLKKNELLKLLGDE